MVDLEFDSVIDYQVDLQSDSEIDYQVDLQSDSEIDPQIDQVIVYKVLLFQYLDQFLNPPSQNPLKKLLWRYSWYYNSKFDLKQMLGILI